MMSDRVTLKIGVEIKTDDGEPFVDADITYHSLDKAQMAGIEAAFVGGMSALMDATDKPETAG